MRLINEKIAFCPICFSYCHVQLILILQSPNFCCSVWNYSQYSPGDPCKHVNSDRVHELVKDRNASYAASDHAMSCPDPKLHYSAVSDHRKAHRIIFL